MEKIGWIILQANQVDVASKVFILLLMAIISYGRTYWNQKQG